MAWASGRPPASPGTYLSLVTRHSSFDEVAAAEVVLAAGRDAQGLLVAVSDHAGAGALDLAHVAPGGAVDLDAAGRAVGAVVGRQLRRRLEDGLVGLLPPAGPLDDDVRAGHAAGVEPGVVGGGDVEGDRVVLRAGVADEDLMATARPQRLRAAAAR